MSDQYQNESEIHAVVNGFESCSTGKADFTHADHLTVAVSYLRRVPFDQATELMRASLFRFTEHHGVAGKYHETLTVFWLRVAQRRLAELEPDSSLLSATNEVVSAFSDSRLPLEYYSEERLWSDEARRIWLESDLKSL